MKHLLVFILLLLPCHIAIAEDADSRLVVWRSDGSKIVYSLSEHPKTTFTSEGVVITTNTVSITYPLPQIVKYTYECISSGIESVTNEDEVLVSQDGYNFRFCNLKENTPVQVYSVNGSLISAQKNKGRHFTISLGDHANGVYIIKVGDTSYKVIKR